jgi:hypothetical protein
MPPRALGRNPEARRQAPAWPEPTCFAAAAEGPREQAPSKTQRGHIKTATDVGRQREQPATARNPATQLVTSSEARADHIGVLKSLSHKSPDRNNLDENYVLYTSTKQKHSQSKQKMH